MSTRLHSLDGLRGLAALAVAFSRCMAVYRIDGNPRSKTASARCSISCAGSAFKTSASASAGPRSTRCALPEVEYIGEDNARAPFEFGCKVSIVASVTARKGRQFVLHATALHGNPSDGHTLGAVIHDLEKLIGVAVRRIHGDKGYRSHNSPPATTSACSC